MVKNGFPTFLEYGCPVRTPALDTTSKEKKKKQRKRGSCAVV